MICAEERPQKKTKAMIDMDQVSFGRDQRAEKNDSGWVSSCDSNSDHSSGTRSLVIHHQLPSSWHSDNVMSVRSRFCHWKETFIRWASSWSTVQTKFKWKGESEETECPFRIHRDIWVEWSVSPLDPIDEFMSQSGKEDCINPPTVSSYRHGADDQTLCLQHVKTTQRLCLLGQRVQLFEGLLLGASCIHGGLCWLCWLRVRFANFNRCIGFFKDFVSFLFPTLVFEGDWLHPAEENVFIEGCTCFFVRCGAQDRGHRQMPSRLFTDLWAHHCRVTSCGDPFDQTGSEWCQPHVQEVLVHYDVRRDHSVSMSEQRPCRFRFWQFACTLVQAAVIGPSFLVVQVQAPCSEGFRGFNQESLNMTNFLSCTLSDMNWQISCNVILGVQWFSLWEYRHQSDRETSGCTRKVLQSKMLFVDMSPVYSTYIRLNGQI